MKKSQLVQHTKCWKRISPDPEGVARRHDIEERDGEKNALIIQLISGCRVVLSKGQSGHCGGGMLCWSTRGSSETVKWHRARRKGKLSPWRCIMNLRLPPQKNKSEPLGEESVHGQALQPLEVREDRLLSWQEWGLASDTLWRVPGGAEQSVLLPSWTPCPDNEVNFSGLIVPPGCLPLLCFPRASRP